MPFEQIPRDWFSCDLDENGNEKPESTLTAEISELPINAFPEYFDLSGRWENRLWSDSERRFKMQSIDRNADDEIMGVWYANAANRKLLIIND